VDIAWRAAVGAPHALSADLAGAQAAQAFVFPTFLPDRQARKIMSDGKEFSRDGPTRI